MKSAHRRTARAIVIPRRLSPRYVPFVTRARYVSRNSISLSQYRVTAPISMRARVTFGTFRRGVLSGEAQGQHVGLTAGWGVCADSRSLLLIGESPWHQL